jgi:shikimate 5-dehydrogenase
MDTVYRPAQTRLLREAAARGCETVSGMEMFLAQAVAQHALWHGGPPPVDAMKVTLAAAAKAERG